MNRIFVFGGQVNIECCDIYDERHYDDGESFYDQYHVISCSELTSVELYQNKGKMRELLIDNLIFFIGGKLSEDATTNIVEVFDINTNSIYNPNTNNYSMDLTIPLPLLSFISNESTKNDNYVDYEALFCISISIALVLFGVLLIVIVLCKTGYLNVPGAPDINLNKFLSRKRNNGIVHSSLDSVADKSINPYSHAHAHGYGHDDDLNHDAASNTNIVEQAEDDPDDIAYAQNENDEYVCIIQDSVNVFIELIKVKEMMIKKEMLHLIMYLMLILY